MLGHGSLNHLYRLVWSKTQGAWIAVAETTRGQGKGSSRKLLVAVVGLSSALAQASPEGGLVVSGTGSIAQSGATTTITQTTRNLSLNWDSFNIAARETVTFNQPSAAAIAVNRIMDSNGTQILGNLNANGQVYLINPNGILFGQNAQVNVGALVASTLDLDDASLNSDSRSFSGAGTGSVINQGTINAADGGYVALLGNSISNQGTITAPGGSVALGAGSAVTLTFADNSLVQMQVDESLLDNLADNGGLIQANGGRVLLSAGARDSLLASVVNNTGVIEARSVENHDGVIVLLGGMAAGTTKVAGTLDASAPDGGDGGFIETSAAHVNVADGTVVTTLAANGQTGQWLIDPSDYTIAASGGNITGAAVSRNLASSNIRIETTGANGDIYVNDAVTWGADNSLTLDAHRDININQSITATGENGKLVLEYGQDATDGVISGVAADYNVNAPVNLQAGNNFSTQLGSTGTVKEFIVITSLGEAGSTTTTDLQGIDGNLSGHYALGDNIDAADTLEWNDNAGFDTLGTFSGSFDGLGHSIANLSINSPTTDYIGLFRIATAGSVITNVGLLDASVTGKAHVGGLVGYDNGGTISNSYITGNVAGELRVGGLVGSSDLATISNSYATANVTATDNNAGGLVGHFNNSKISNSYASGSLSSGDFRIGGLVAESTDSSTISNSYWDTVTTGQSRSPGGGSGKTTADLLKQTTYAGFDFGNTWFMVEGSTRPFLRNEYSTSIGNAHQLQLMSLNLAADYTLTNNLDLAAELANPSGMWGTASTSQATGITSGFAPISYGFSGSFDGLGHTISNLSIDRPSTNFVGLFGFTATGSVIDNVGLLGASVSGNDKVGGLVGRNGGTISNSYATGSVHGEGYDVGGLVGLIVEGTVSNSYATGSVSSTGGNTGGLVGRGYNGIISNSYATGITASSGSAGGLVGSVSGGSISNSYWDTVTTGQSTSAGGGADRTTSQLLTQATYRGFDFNNTWFMVEGSTRPFLRSEYSTTITNAHQLQLMAIDLSADYTLTNNLDLATELANPSGLWGGSSAGFFPIGNHSTGFSGSIDGLGHTISNLSIDRPSTSYIGLFGDTTAGSLIDNLGLLDASVTGANRVATLAGSTYGTVNNSYATGSVNGDIAGVLIGENNGTISNSYATGNVSGLQRLGGLVGFNNNNNKISNSYADVTVSGSYETGGLVGYNGYNAEISNSYATGSVTNNTQFAGGLVGVNYNNAKIINSYATGPVSGIDGKVGGLVGSDTGTITLSYWDTATTGQSTSAGNKDSGTGLSTADIHKKASFSDEWDLADTGGSGAVWRIYEDHSAPLLTHFMTDLTLADTAVTYNSAAQSGGDFTSIDKVLGAAATETNAGIYNDYHSTQQGFDIKGGGLIISQADLSVTGLTATAKTYDANTTATLGGTAAIAKLGTDDVSVSGTASGLFADKNVDTGKAITVTGNSLSGIDAGNYNLVQQTDLTADILKADLLVTGLAATAKTYDANTTATLGGTAAIAKLGTDDVTVGGTASGLFADKNVDTGKAITVTGNSISGDDAGNYNLLQQAGLSADISKADLSVTGLTVGDKIYDATTDAILGGTAAITKLGSDDVSVGGTASGLFADKNVDTGKTITVTGNSLSGTDAGNYNLLQQAGLSADISKADLSVTGLAATAKTYDATTDAILGGTAAITKLGSDDVSVGGTASGLFADKNVDTGKTITVTGNSLSGTDAGNYNLLQQAGLSADISKADLSVTGLAATAKTYDATTDAILGGTAAITKLGSDDVSVGGTASGLFADKNVDTGKTITVTGNSLSGTDAGNYNLLQQAGLSADISKADLSVTGLTVGDKVYDATTDAILGGTAAITKLGSDDVSVGGTASGLFADKNVADGKTITVTGNSLSGTDAGNYNLLQQAGLSADISKADLSVTGLTVGDKTYDATTDAILGGTAAITKLGSDDVSVGGSASGLFADKNVDTGKGITVTGNSISGDDAGNYNLLQQAGLSADISKADLSVTGLTVGDKIYDATTDAILGGTAAITKLGSDDVTVGGTASGLFADKNVDTGKTITVTGNSLSGTDAGNYNLLQQAGLSADISKADLSVTGLTVGDKIYDATTDAILGGTAAITKLGSDDVSLGGSASGLFADKNVDTGKTITVTGNSLSGTDAGNYNLLQQTGLTADITQADLLVTGLTAGDKTYNANTAAILGGTAAVAAISGDDVTLDGTAGGLFADKNVATDKTIDVTGNSLSGDDAGNYNLVQQAGLTADITQADLLVTGLTAGDKTYNANTTAALGGTAAVTALDGDSVILDGTAGGLFADKNVATDKTIDVTGNSLSGDDAGNYNLVQQAGLTADITQADLLVTGLTAGDKTYNANAIAALGGTSAVAAISGDDVTLDGTAGGLFADKNVGSDKTVTASGNTLSGDDAGNYNLVQQAGLTADITQADLLVTGLTAGDKTYNGDSSATLNTANLLLTGLIDGDALSLSATGLFADKNAAADKTVTLASHYTGADVSNYAIVDQTTTTADITQAALTYSATAVSFFSGQAPGELSGGVSGFVAGETLIGSTSGAPTWTTEAGATSQPGSYAINGAGLTAGNYRFVQGAGNASALTLTPGTATNPVVQVTAQLASSVLSPQVRSQPQALNGSSSVRVSQSDNSDNGSADDSSADDANSAALNTQMAIASGGPAMQIVSGGVNLPETMVAE